MSDSNLVEFRSNRLSYYFALIFSIIFQALAVWVQMPMYLWSDRHSIQIWRIEWVGVGILILSLCGIIFGSLYALHGEYGLLKLTLLIMFILSGLYALVSAIFSLLFDNDDADDLDPYG